MRRLSATIAIGIAMVGGIAIAAPAADWAWLFPVTPASEAVGAVVHHVPGSDRGFTEEQVHDLAHAVDWFPAEHPAMSGLVGTGHGKANACAFCHQPDGNGRPENSPLAGLSADYIKQQIAAFADGSRQAAVANALPIKLMISTAKTATPAEIDEAANYFSKLRYVSHVRVVETQAVSFKPARFFYVLRPGAPEPIGERIIEVPADPAGFEHRDPHMRFIAFVPRGAIAAGRALVASGGAAGQPCTICHGAGLRGGIAPPLAGRSPTTLIRQLAAFKVGARANAEAAPMRAITAQLSDRALIDLAAYAATLTS